MKKILIVLLVCCIICFTGCNTKAKEEALAETVEVNSEIGEISFVLNGYWKIKTSEEKENIKISDSQMNDLEFYHSLTGSNVNIIYDDLTKIKGATLVRTLDYVNKIKENLEASADYTYQCSEISSEIIHKKEYISFSARMEEVEGIQHFFIRRIGNQMMTMIITLYEDDSLDDIIKLSSASSVK